MTNEKTAPQGGEVTAAEAADAEAQALWNEFEASDPGGKPGSDAPPAEQASAEPEQPSAQPEPQPEDPWAAVPQQLREEYERVRHQAQSDRGRVSALQRQLDEVRNAKPSKDRTENLNKVRGKIEALEADYPELAAPMKDIVDSIGEEVQDLRAAEDRRIDAAKYELTAHIEAETGRLDAMAPGWFDFVKANGAAFTDWVNDQPRHVREAAIQNAEYVVDAEAAFAVVNSFRESLEARAKPASRNQQQPQNTRRERQLAASASPRSTVGNMPVTSGIPKDADPQVSWDYFERLDREKRA